MIAIAGTIGTGLFLGSGSAIAQGGAVGTFLGYTVLSTFIGFMMYSLVSPAMVVECKQEQATKNPQK